MAPGGSRSGDRLPRPPVLVLNFNGWDDTFATLDALIADGQDAWLIDNGSGLDRTAEAAARRPGLTTMRHPENLGWAGGYNRALDEVARRGHAYAYLLNNDAIPLPGAIASTVRTLAEAGDVAAVGSVIVDADDRHVWFDGVYADPAQPLGVEALGPGARAVRTINGAGFLLNLEAWRAVGPFHEDYFLYHEEADWCVRAGVAGWRLLVDGGSRVRHAREASDSGSNASYYRVRNHFLALRRGVALNATPDTRLTLVADQLRHIRSLRGEARRAARIGLYDGLHGRFGQRGPRPGALALGLTIAACAAAVTPLRLWRRLRSR